MKYFLYIASYFPFIAMIVFYISTISLVFISGLDRFLNLEFSVKLLATKVYEPFVIAIIVLTVILPLSMAIYYFIDIGWNVSIKDDEKKNWRSFLLKTTVLGPMFYYDYKYKDSIIDYTGMTLFRDSRDKMMGYFDIVLPLFVKNEIQAKGSHNRHDFSLYFFLVGIVTIALSVVVSIFQ